jgi:hypothetical protein
MGNCSRRIREGWSEKQIEWEVRDLSEVRTGVHN